MNPDWDGLWVYLSGSPLLGLTATLLIYSLSVQLYERLGRPGYLHPVATAIAVLASGLLLFGIEYQHYFAGAQFVHFLLGPATVALAVPLYQQLGKLRQMALPVAVALLTGILITLSSALLIASVLGADELVQRSLLAKSVTTPVAMGISQAIGGIPSLTACVVIATGIFGAVIGPGLMSRCGIRDPAVQGVALGSAAHGVGTARGFQLNVEMGSFAVWRWLYPLCLAVYWCLGWCDFGGKCEGAGSNKANFDASSSGLGTENQGIDVLCGSKITILYFCYQKFLLCLI
ncbi:LrgB family protein [Ferrimonas pelagia]|uniref:LrgB family protein n=1 Tax=Ferrimonas pelagia TaxID=1177826 RepID=A0ABP9FCR9_9GAMM